MSVRHPDARERRTIAIGAAIVAVAVLGVFVGHPLARRWGERESAIAAARERVARLEGLAAQEAQLVAAVRAGNAGDLGSVRLLRGRTPALVASTLQSLLQDLARTSRVSITRLDVGSPVDSTASPERGVLATISATTDIYGVADFLSRLHAGPALLRVESLSITANPVLRGNLQQVALDVRAPYVLEP